MPFLDAALLGGLSALAEGVNAVGFDAVVPRLDGTPQTLHALYARTCLPVVERLLESGRPGLRDLLASVAVRYVEGAELGDADRWRRSWFSVNTPADLATVEAWLAEASAHGEPVEL